MEGARPAQTGDLDRLAALADEALDEQRGARGGDLLARRDSRPRPAGEWLAAAITDPDQRVLVGTITTDDGHEVIVGYAVAYVEQLRDGAFLAVVDELFVEPAARAVAVGEAIMDDLIGWGTARGCIGIDSVVLPGNRESKNFFERFGLKARSIIVHRSFEADR